MNSPWPKTYNSIPILSLCEFSYFDLMRSQNEVAGVTDEVKGSCYRPNEVGNEFAMAENVKFDTHIVSM